MGLGKNYAGQDCTLARALELVGERWTIVIVRDALYGVRRFKDFLARMDIPRAVLADRLQTLMAAGVLEKRPYQDSPVRHEYVLTDLGVELWPVVHSLAMWGQRLPDSGLSSRTFRHVVCNEELGVGGACPACGLVVPPREVEMVPGPGVIRDDPVSRVLNEPRRLLEPVVRD